MSNCPCRTRRRRAADTGCLWVSYRVEALRLLGFALGSDAAGLHARMSEHLTLEEVIKTRGNRFGKQRSQGLLTPQGERGLDEILY